MAKKTEEIKTFEDYLTGAKAILEELAKPDVTLTKSVALYKDGLKSLEEANKLLDEAKLIVEEANVK